MCERILYLLAIVECVVACWVYVEFVEGLI